MHLPPLIAITMPLVVLLSAPAFAQQALDVDVESASAFGTYLLDGAPLLSMPGEDALVHLDSVIGESVPLGSTSDLTYGPIPVLLDRYDVRYDFAQSFSGDLPVNTGTLLATGLLVDGSGALDIDIPTALIQIDLLLNGAAFPVSPSEFATIELRHVESGAEFQIGSAGDAPLVVRVVAGTYDVVYGYQLGTQIPQNEHAVVLAGADFSSSQSVSIDLTSFTHFIQPLVDGLSFPASTAERGAISLVNFDTGDRVDYGSTNQGTNSRSILPGTYDAVYEHLQGGGIAPANREVVFAEDLVLAPPAMPGQLSLSVLDMTTHEVSPSVTFDGVAPPMSAAERGRIVFSGPLGDQIDFGETDGTLSSWRLLEGPYDVFYQRLNFATIAPANANARIARGVRVLSSGPLPIDIETALLDFDFTLDGLPFPASAAERGRFELVGRDAGDVIDLGETDSSPPTRRVVRGTYHVDYSWLNGSTFVPRNVDSRVASDLLLTTDQTVVVDLPTQSVSPSFLLDGAPFPPDPGDTGQISLVDPSGGELPLGPTHVASPATVLAIEGPYRVDYAWTAGTSVPRNPRGAVGFAAVPEPGFVTGLLVLLSTFAIAARCG